MIERWMPIAEFPKYEISTNGAVRRGGNILKQFVIKGYYAFNVTDTEEQRKSLRTHREVAKAFLPNPEGLPVVRHIDGDPYNCNVENLMWGTCSENEADKERHGTTARGERNGFCKLSDFQVQVIRLSEKKNKDIALEFGVRPEYVSRIRNYHAR